MVPNEAEPFLDQIPLNRGRRPVDGDDSGKPTTYPARTSEGAKPSRRSRRLGREEVEEEQLSKLPARER
jgi:hypothetical protein